MGTTIARGDAKDDGKGTSRIVPAGASSGTPDHRGPEVAGAAGAGTAPLDDEAQLRRMVRALLDAGLNAVCRSGQTQEEGVSGDRELP
jgi:hypothetical protein